MKFKILTLIFIVICTSSKAQIDEYGLSMDVNINSLSAIPSKFNGIKQAVSKSLVYENKSTSIGYFIRNENFIYAINFDVSAFDEDFMVDDKYSITDNYYNHEQFVFADLKNKNSESYNDIGFSFLFGMKIVGNDKLRLNLMNRLGMKNVSTRTSNVVLKEDGSNNYYFANYKFIMSPLTFYMPSLEFEYFPFDMPISFYMHTGLNFQYFKCTSQVEIIDVNKVGFTTADHDNNYYINLSTTLMTGIGIRASLW